MSLIFKNDSERQAFIKGKVHEELDRYRRVCCMRKGIVNIFRSDLNNKLIKMKEVQTIIANMLFFPENDIFFPYGSKWKESARNKLLYSETKDHEQKIKEIEKILEEIRKMKGCKYDKIKLVIYKTRYHGKRYYGFRTMIIEDVFVIAEIYDKYVRSVQNEWKKWINELILLQIIRYDLELSSKNHQLAIRYSDVTIDGMTLEKWTKHELTASPFNVTEGHDFCSAYPDIDFVFTGNRGNLFNYRLESSKNYTYNPPYEEIFMNDGAIHILQELDRDDIHGVNIFITVPVWDYATAEKLGVKVPLIEKMENGKKVKVIPPYLVLETLKKSKYLDKIETFSMKDYEYYNHWEQRKVSVANTYHIILRKK